MNYNIETGVAESAISIPICNRVINCDVSEDVSIPEGFPEVRRVLALKENILSPAKFVGAKAVDFSGAVDYTIVYLGADGNICSAPFSAEYSFSLPLENADKMDINEGVSVICSLCGDGGNVRISTPRRLQIRAGIRASVICFGRGILSEDLRGVEDSSSLQRLRLESECAFLDCESSDIVTLTDEYIIGEGARVVYSDADVFLNDTRIDGEVVRVSGEAVIKLLVQNGDDIERVIRKIPFDAETDLEELELDGSSVLCRAYGNVNELDITVEEGRARIEIGIVLEVCVAQNREVAYTRDIYSTSQVCDAEYRTASLPIILLNKNANITQSERISCSDIRFPEGAEIIDVWGSAVCEEGLLENRRYVLRGNVKYKLICRNGTDISVCECELPFKYEGESGERDVGCICARVGVTNARARSDGENLLIESELSVSASVFGSVEFEALSAASFGEERETPKNQLVVCFKSDSENSFELAKRYGVELDKIGGESSDSFVIIER